MIRTQIKVHIMNWVTIQKSYSAKWVSLEAQPCQPSCRASKAGRSQVQSQLWQLDLV